MSQELQAAQDLDAPISFANVMAAPALAAIPVRERLMNRPENVAKVKNALSEVSTKDPNSLIMWGAGAQKELGDVSLELIEKTKSKDSGPAGSALTTLVLRIRGFDVSDIKPAEHKATGVLKWLHKQTLPIQIATQRFTGVQNQVNEVVRALDRHVGVLMRDLEVLKRLYEKNVEAYEHLQVYVEAARILRQQIKDVELPALQAAITEDDAMSSQRYADLLRFEQRLERREADLVLTRTAVFQGLPAIALIGDNDVNLVEQIQSTIVNAVPLWYRQIAMCLAARRGAEAAEAKKSAHDLTNTLLVETAKLVGSASASQREAIEQGMFDSAALKQANDIIIGSLQGAIQVYDDAAKRRIEDMRVADQCEVEMRKTIEGVRRIGINVAA